MIEENDRTDEPEATEGDEPQAEEPVSEEVQPPEEPADEPSADEQAPEEQADPPPDQEPEGQPAAEAPAEEPQAAEPEAPAGEQRPKAKDQPPRRVNRLFSRLDSTGWTIDRPKHLFVVPADGSAKPVALTTGAFEDSGVQLGSAQRGAASDRRGGWLSWSFAC